MFRGCNKLVNKFIGKKSRFKKTLNITPTLSETSSSYDSMELVDSDVDTDFDCRDSEVSLSIIICQIAQGIPVYRYFKAMSVCPSIFDYSFLFKQNFSNEKGFKLET